MLYHRCCLCRQVTHGTLLIMAAKELKGIVHLKLHPFSTRHDVETDFGGISDSPNCAGVSQREGIPLRANTMEAHGGYVFKHQKTKQNNR